MKRVCILLTAVLSLIAFSSCNKTEIDTPTTEDEETKVKKYVNMFAFNMFNTYYLWNEDISSKLQNWSQTADPVQTVKSARYKDSSGNDIDRWTQLTDDYKGFTSSVAGTSTTYGFEFQLYYYDSAMTTLCCVVTLVYADSPAAKAGMKRGDCIVKIGGKSLGTDNYYDILTNDFYGKSSCTLTLYGGASVTMTQVEMYEDPVILFKTFDCNGKKVGYMVYNSFTQASYLRLIEACKYFKGEGISELILDLRYNGGGYTTTEQAFASMLAPEQNVTAGDVFETDIYNKILTQAMGKSETCFKTDFKTTVDGQEVHFSTADANIGIKKIYALVTSSSASASESLVGCLKPYLDVDIIGGQTHGKFCGGIIYSAEEWFGDVKDQLDSKTYAEALKYTDNWGIYIMISRYADKNGVTLSMPDGIEPDCKASDNPDEGLQLGDPNESMLKVALQRAGYNASAKATAISAAKNAPYGKLTPLPADRQFRRTPCLLIIDR